MIQVRNLVFQYNTTTVLDDLSFSLNKDETTVVIGRSGVGKSTLLRCIVGLVRPTSGSILVEGADITAISEEELNLIRRNFGVLFQGAALFNSMTVSENVAFPLRQHRNYDKQKIREIVREKLSLVDLEGCEDMMPSELSGGMKKRAGLARALALDPKCIFFDEPLAGLDPIIAGDIDELILKLKKVAGMTMMIVTHELLHGFRVADKIIMLHEGKIIATGKPAEIVESDDEYVQQFLRGLPDIRSISG
ncbi:MAG: ABC transporter ATP-binding protein [Candidatus Abyssobacteria bacterium SURF_17]|uniref:ABC transporter ATP-binding protein n=1 Tax=Candidatus Abyssobacteria bacterium SURF_17 TaxID=2093361 RepID=A0A419ERW4_9BACT|nr:MAG: ABC transporter ATP-binding protein [Candidatus Abyssubacteria bacterium SURF_17]